MSEARRNLDWDRQFELAIDEEKARRYRAESTPEREDTCTMCGKMCAVRNINKILRGEKCGYHGLKARIKVENEGTVQQMSGSLIV